MAIKKQTAMKAKQTIETKVVEKVETKEEVVAPIKKLNEQVSVKCLKTHISTLGVFEKGKVYVLDRYVAENQVKNGVSELC